jgi:hypothetical protein
MRGIELGDVGIEDGNGHLDHRPEHEKPHHGGTRILQCGGHDDQQDGGNSGPTHPSTTTAKDHGRKLQGG